MYAGPANPPTHSPRNLFACKSTPTLLGDKVLGISISSWVIFAIAKRGYKALSAFDMWTKYLELV